MKPLYYQYAASRLLHWLGISRTPASWVARLSLILLCALPLIGMQYAISWGVAALLLGTFILLIKSQLRQIRLDYRDDIEHQVLIIGVGETTGLMTAIPEHIRGQRISYEIPQPLRALHHLLSVEERICEALHCQPPAGVRVVYAGQAPSPVAFLLGFYLGYTRIDAIMESQPASANPAQSWRLLDALDDGQRFETLGLELLQAGTPEATIVMTCGDVDALVQGLALDHPLIHMVLPGSASTLMSASKQICLANQFGAVLHALADHGVKTVHLRYAGPHSLLFNLGREYRRSHQLTMVLYAHEDGVAADWGIRIPASAREVAEIISADDELQSWSPAPFQERQACRLAS